MNVVLKADDGVFYFANCLLETDAIQAGGTSLEKRISTVTGAANAAAGIMIKDSSLCVDNFGD